MKKRFGCIGLVSVVYIVLLSGCSLFPLREEASVPSDTQLQDTSEESTESEAIMPESIEPDLNTPEPEESSVPKDVIKPMEIPQENKNKNKYDNVMYCISPVNVRDAASVNSTVIGELSAGEEVTAYNKTEGWIEIDYKGQRAYVYEEYLSGSLNDN